MSEKRRDNRNRVLHVGESQRPDGRHAYKYKDLNGDIKFVYSWRLDKNDRTPAGRARDLSLREKERQIQQDLFNKVVPNGGDLTVLELVEKYLSLKVNVRHNTLANYNFVLNIIKKEDFGKFRIDRVKQSDTKAWLIKMQKVDGRGYSSIHAIRGVVRPAFEMALQAYLKQVQQHLQSSASENHTSCVPPYLLLQHGKERHESQNLAVYHGTCGYQHHTGHLYPHPI